MKSIYTLLLAVVALSSCMSSYNIQGTSNVQNLDGKKLYLKVLKEGDFKNIDSCEVVHGQFHFSGSIDSVCMGHVFMDEGYMMPIVVEQGDIKVLLDRMQQTVSGTELNETLFDFVSKFNELQAKQQDLVHQHDQAIMEGKDMDVVTPQLEQQAVELEQQLDKLVTAFITDNFDNVLGPGVFFMFTIDHQIPMLSPWIEDIMSKATDKFKNDEYVRDYYNKAVENQEIMNGMRDVPAALPAPADNLDAVPAPTPNELAKPAE